MSLKRVFASAVAVAALQSAPGHAAGVLDFDVSFDPNVVFSQAQIEAVNNATSYWESQIQGYANQDLADAVGVFELEVSFEANGSLVLGTATPIFGDPNFTIATEGRVWFNSDRDYSGFSQVQLDDIMRHEFAHALGFIFAGFFFNGLTTEFDGVSHYTGASALAEYRATVDPLAPFVPLEDDGPAGAIRSHWDEFNFADHGANLGLDPEICDIVDTLSFSPGDCPGADNPELMTVILGSGGPATVSTVTLAVFEDLGYELASGSATSVPLPAGGMLLLSGLGAFVLMRRRRSSC